jgi:hypothetical protein
MARGSCNWGGAKQVVNRLHDAKTMIYYRQTKVNVEMLENGWLLPGAGEEDEERRGVA